MPLKNPIIIILALYLFIGNNTLTECVCAKNNYKVGERMIYAIKWNGIRIGVDIVELDEITKIRSQNAYRVVSQTFTQGVVNAIFSVKDRVETYIDTETLLPMLYKKDINEGKYHKKADYEFDQNNGIVNTLSERYEISKGVQDPLSILGYFRTLDIKLNDIIEIKYFSGTEVDILKVSVIRKELIKTPVGDFNTNVVTLSVGKKERNYLKNKVNLWIWFTDDDRKIPVFIKCSTTYGNITGTLIDYVEGE
ncbi:MAG: DUF3108 domain-containing protein [bacterium]|nr:DUF3108 domain-containing protein [bacterium]